MTSVPFRPPRSARSNAPDRAVPPCRTHEHASRALPILLYHSVATDAAPALRRWVVDPCRFEAHLDHLAAAGYRTITVSAAGAAVRRDGRFPDRAVVVTFDDAFADFASAAAPRLLERGMTATLYVPTAYIGSTSRWLTSEGEQHRRVLTWGQLVDLDAAGIEIGAHGHTHRPLDVLPRRDVVGEILTSKRVLEDRLGHEVSAFAYPHGYSSSFVRRAVAEAGFSTACAVRHALARPGDDPYALARVIVGHDTDSATLARLLRGDGIRHGRPVGMRVVGWRAVRRTCDRWRRWRPPTGGAGA